MNWLKKTIGFGEKIKKILKKRPSKEEIESSEWTSCCKGPVLKKADGLVVGSALCKEISQSIKKRQNPVTKVSNMVKKLRRKLI